VKGKKSLNLGINILPFLTVTVKIQLLRKECPDGSLTGCKKRFPPIYIAT